MSIPVSFYTATENGLVKDYPNIKMSNYDKYEIEDEEVYLVVTGVDALCGNHEHLKKFKTYSTEEGDYKTTYFQTHGGGPEGGYFLRTFYPLNGFDPVNEVYEVERGWGGAFIVGQMNGCLDYNEAGDGTAGTCCFIPDGAEDEDILCMKCNTEHEGNWCPEAEEFCSGNE
jgi:hypothetical protein